MQIVCKFNLGIMSITKNDSRDNPQYQISLFLDTRRKKLSNSYPVKIRAWDANSRMAKLFKTGIDLTKRDFEGAWISGKYAHIDPLITL